MTKIVKLLQCLFLSVLILGAETKKADAFFLIPPMPWDIEVDIPGNANKIVSNVKAAYRELQTVKAEFNTQKLEVLKKAAKFAVAQFKGSKEGGKNKAPGKGKLQASEKLGISADSLNEEEFFNAYNTLFLVYPPQSSYPDNYSSVKTAFKKKTAEYQQDIIMETYLVGRVTEDYLSLVEKTIDRLDRCQKGFYKESTPENCVFFGLTMAYINPQQTEDELGDSESSTNPGQYGEMLNAYIVTTVYDRLMRIVQDLTATEAQFVAAMQIDMVDPIEPEEQSSAADYLDNGYRFAYNDSREYTLADGTMLGGIYKRSEACESGGKDCADFNEDRAELKNTDDTAILGKLQPIDDQISQAISLHNLKAQLDDYKLQYRKYLKAKEIHQRMLDVLTQSEKCVIGFLDKYSGGQGKTLWYGEGSSQPAIANEHEKRVEGSLSRTVIEEYQEDTTDTIIGSSKIDECDGYYEVGSCPEGYTEGETCKYMVKDESGKEVEVENKNYVACVLDTVTADTEPKAPTADYNQKLLPKEGYETVAQDSNLDYDDTDFLMDGTVADDIETENRIKAEKSWRIGYDHIMKMTEDGILKFDPWNDQKNLQSEYLRNKYRNMRMIVKMVDEGMMSYRVATTQALQESNPGVIEKVLPAITACKLTTEATVEDAFQEFCTNDGYSGSCTGSSGDSASCSAQKTIQCTCYNSEGIAYTCPKIVPCNISGSNDSGYINGTKTVDCDGTQKSETYDQRIITSTGGCAFPKPSTPYSAIEVNDGQCPGIWDFSTKFLVQRYMPAVVGSWKNGGAYEATCPGGINGLDAQTTHLYTNAKSAGRKVASDYLKPVLEVRLEAEEALKNLVKEYEKKMAELKNELRKAIEDRGRYSKDLDEATEDKNKFVQERQRSIEHISGLVKDLDNLENVRVPALEARLKDRNPKPESLQNDLDSLLRGAGEDLEKIKNPTLAEIIGIIPAMKEELAFLCANAPENISECNGWRNVATGKSKDEMQKELYEGLDVDKIFENVMDTEDDITEAQEEMDDAQSFLDVQQEKIDAKSEEIREYAQTFADTYIKEATAWQEKIEAENELFEKKLEVQNDVSDPARMENTRRPWCTKERRLGVLDCKDKYQTNDYKYDNLSWTMARVLYSTVDKNDHDGVNDDARVQSDLKGIILDSIEERWFSGGKWGQYPAMLESNGVVDKFVIANGALAAQGIPDGVYTPASIALKLKDIVKEDAMELIKDKYIKDADTTIKKEVDSAADEITAVMEKWGVTGEEGTEPSEEIYIHENYADDGEANGGQSVTAEHYALIEKLKQAENQAKLDLAGIKLEESFGIPADIVTDDNYYVGLPARGLYTITVPTFGKQKEELIPSISEDVDSNNGRDYKAPRKPLLNLAPLREVFYFSAMDYDDVPKKDNKPSLSTLVDKKYKHTTIEIAEAIEYLPETWRYLLATPNFRKDGLYQQTFVERSYGTEKLKDYINNADIPGAEESHYRAIIGRAGVYPCKLGKQDNKGKIVNISSNKVIDVGGGDGVGDMSFKQRSSIPSGATVQTCQEVASYKNGVRQLLADHNPLDEGDSKALQKSLGKTDEPMYEKYSELGQFLNGNLEYRPMLRNIYDYLLNDENQENSIKRQLADLATFKRNVIGSFLEAVNAERNAEKTLDNNKEDVIDALENLCQQMHNLGESVSGEELCEDTSDSECVNAKAAECAQLIMENGGLAKDSSDDVYSVSCGMKNEDGSYYDQIFCKLDELKNEAIRKAKQGYSDELGEHAGYNNLEINETDKDRVQERLNKIENYFAALGAPVDGEDRTGDPDELATIQPDATGASAAEAAEEAEINKTAVRTAEEEGLMSMDNQSQAVAYCPVY